ncbi:MAG: type II toxin-antitoxin system RelE/ParE family toxin [Myxococcales bacterium]|nr:type II toxin-antitoxin system RelE/ParE family toxin [Myxococcales bacterium]
MSRSVAHDVAARHDLIEMWQFGLERWDVEQADRYLDELRDALDTLAAMPQIGRRRGELIAGYWSLPFGSHVVFYTFTDTELRLRRVLHGSRDPQRHL